ncbi:MAG: hypothetical protein MJY56_05860 [Bacteroidales bacterium]|nr:hypothetical protein [Bacteroidales bacterium]
MKRILVVLVALGLVLAFPGCSDPIVPDNPSVVDPGGDDDPGTTDDPGGTDDPGTTDDSGGTGSTEDPIDIPIPPSDPVLLDPGATPSTSDPDHPVEYGPLVKVESPYLVDFETGFPTTQKPTYYKYGLTAGPENVEWTTWFGSFSWQNPIEGSQSAQLRVYQEDEDYEKPQFGYLKTEFFVKDLVSVSFSYWMSEFWLKATVSWCAFGEAEWRNPVQIALTEYSQREQVRDFKYVLDGGKPCDAMIKIEIDPATGHPSKDHYALVLDYFVFNDK